MEAQPYPFSALSAQPPASQGFKNHTISLENIVQRSTNAAGVLTLACFVVFTFLIGFDVWRAFKKRAIWLPGKTFALSGVTVQIIAWWTSISHFETGYNRDIYTLLDDHYMVVSGRVAVCVFIGYLLPGMAAPSVGTYGALAITICAQIASELFLLYDPVNNESESAYFDYGYLYSECVRKSSAGSMLSSIDEDCMKRHFSEDLNQDLPYEKKDITWSQTADLILFICMIVLGLILCCTVLASRTIKSLLKQRNSAIAKESKSEFSVEKMKSTCSISEQNDFEDEVLRAWFVARVCQVDYVICRSVLSSAVWIIVTICVIVFYKSVSEAYFYSSFMSPLPCFMMVAWVVICWRWLAAQLYCAPRYSFSRRWETRWLCWEDFWTSHIVQLIDMYDLKRERQQFHKSNSKMSWLNKLQDLPARIFTIVRLHKLLYLVLVLQVCVVLLCKVCGFLSEVTVGEFLYWCPRFVNWRPKCMKENLVVSREKYTEILECLCMPGEDVSVLWEANKMSLNKAKLLMMDGCEEGSSSSEINSIFHTYSPRWARKGTRRLKELGGIVIDSVVSHFSSVDYHYVKMTVVSLITVYIELHRAKSDRLTKAMKGCREVWDLISFVDECDIDLEADKINLLGDFNRENDQVCMAANKKFYKLQRMYEKLPPECENCFQDAESVHGLLERLSKKCEDVLKEENLLQCNKKFPKDLRDSKYWTDIAPSYSLYKVCKLMLHENENNQHSVPWTNQDLVKWIEKSLRNIIACSMSKLPDMIVKQCWIWAEKFEEDKLWEAIQLAGKCMGMMEKWGSPMKESPSQGDQTSSNTE